jgi:hypothetical protein
LSKKPVNIRNMAQNSAKQGLGTRPGTRSPKRVKEFK